MERDPKNLLIPFRRDKQRDFASGTGRMLRKSQVKQLLSTEPGELPWRTAFGTPLGRLRHGKSSVVRAELGRVSIRDAFRRWLPAVEVTRVRAEVDGSEVGLRVKHREHAQPDSSFEAQIEI